MAKKTVHPEKSKSGSTQIWHTKYDRPQEWAEFGIIILNIGSTVGSQIETVTCRHSQTFSLPTVCSLLSRLPVKYYKN